MKRHVEPTRMSVRAFARRLGVCHSTVRKAIASGRLELSIRYDARGAPYIANVALAEQEWLTNANPMMVRFPEDI